MKYTQIPTTAFQNIQLNAGVLVDAFNPATGVVGNIIGATSGGINFTDTPSYLDFGDDIDNCPKNMKELKKLDNREVAMSGTFVTVTAATVKMLAGSADVDAQDDNHIIPRNDILQSDFKDLWWVGDYSDVNTGENAGFIAIHLMNALNTSGFQIQSSDKAKGTFAFTFTGHYSMSAQDTVPYEVYVKQGSGSVSPSIYLDKHSLTLETGDHYTFTAVTTPESQAITWSSSATGTASVSEEGVVTAGITAGNAIITAAITVDGVTYTDTCTVIVPSST